MLKGINVPVVNPEVTSEVWIDSIFLGMELGNPVAITDVAMEPEVEEV